MTPPPTGPTGTDLLRAAYAGDRGAVEALYRQYADRLRSLVAARIPPAVAARMDADDVIQSVFGGLCRVPGPGPAPEVPTGNRVWSLLTSLAATKLRDRVAYHRAGRRDAARTSSRPPTSTPRASSGWRSTGSSPPSPGRPGPR